MWRVASEAYAYLAGHPFLTNTVLHNGKTDNERQIINKQHACSSTNQSTYKSAQQTNRCNLKVDRIAVSALAETAIRSTFRLHLHIFRM